MSVVESWIVEDTEKDKTKLYNLSVPKGTWMVSVKVNNDEIWEEYVETGKVKGFSRGGAMLRVLPGVPGRDRAMGNVSRVRGRGARVLWRLP